MAAWRRRWVVHLAGPLLVALLLMVTALLLGGGRPAAVPTGPSDAGPVTAWGLPVARLLFDLCAIAGVGCLLTGAVLVPRSDAGQLVPAAASAVRAASRWALAWAATAVLLLVLTLSEVSGVPAARVLSSDATGSLWSLLPARALLATSLLALVVAGSARRAVSTDGARVTLALALLALTPTLYTGHSSQGADHETATASLVVHVVAGTVWIGGLLGLAVYLRDSHELLARAAARFSALALACFTALTASGLLAAYARLGASPSAWVSSYGVILGLKAIALVALGAIGWQHRRRALGLLAAGYPHAFGRLAAGELVVMAAAVGLAVALSRTPEPPPPDPSRCPATGRATPWAW